MVCKASISLHDVLWLTACHHSNTHTEAAAAIAKVGAVALAAAAASPGSAAVAMAMLASISPLMIILLYFLRLPSPCLFGIGLARRTSLLSTKLVHTCGCMYKARKNKSNIIQRKENKHRTRLHLQAARQRQMPTRCQCRSLHKWQLLSLSRHHAFLTSVSLRMACRWQR